MEEESIIMEIKLPFNKDRVNNSIFKVDALLDVQGFNFLIFASTALFSVFLRSWTFVCGTVKVGPHIDNWLNDWLRSGGHHTTGIFIGAITYKNGI